MTRVVAYVPDLMDRSKLSAAADVNFVGSPAELVTTLAEVAVVDLSRPGVLEALGDLRGIRTIGFASHVDRELMERARTAGCEEVLPRSRFFAQVGDLLAASS